MNKKGYHKPNVKVVEINTTSILAESGSAGATGEDAPWASARIRGSRTDEIIYLDQE